MRNFPTVEAQREASRKLATRLRRERLRAAGFSEAAVIAFTAERLRKVHGLK
jgi:hypothetical protein